MPASRPTAEPSKWRFSLKTLFLLMLLVAVVVWLTSWRMWDLDERIVLGSWFLAIAAAINVSRRRGSRGITLTGILGGLMPAGLGLLYYVIAELVWGYSDIDRDQIAVCTIAVAFVGAAFGGISAMAFTPGGLAELPPSQREDRLQRRLILVTSMVAVVVLGIGVWSACSRSTSWKIRGELWRDPFSMARGDEIISPSSNGSHLKVVGHAKGKRDQRSLMIWKLDPFDARPVFSTSIPADSGTSLAPDGRWLALTEFVESVVRISVLEVATGNEVTQLEIPALAESFDEGVISFSQDGAALRFLTRTQDMPGATMEYRWEVNTWKPMPPLSDVASLSARERLEIDVVELAGERPFDYRDGKFRVELWEPNGEAALHSFGPFEDPYPISLSPHGQQVAIHSSLIDLQTMVERELPAVIEEFLPNGTYLLCSRSYDRYSGRRFWHSGENVPLPFVRHFWSDSDWQQLLVLDTTRGKVIAKSPWIRGSSDRIVASDNGKVALIIDPIRIRVCQIPEY